MVQRVRNHIRLWLRPISQSQSSNTPATNKSSYALRPEPVDVTTHYDKVDLTAIEVLGGAPVWMTGAERLALSSLIYGTRPQRYLEIGTLYGGSALIVSAAMDASGNENGKIVCVDPQPQVSSDHWQQIARRAVMVQGVFSVSFA